MTMIAAVGMAFGLFAATEPSITDNAVNFSEFTGQPINPWMLTDSDGNADALWTYTDGATDATPAENEAKVDGDKLVLATGNKVLARKFADNVVTVDDELGLFANVKVDFQNQGIDADSIPTATDLDGAKLALFLLDTSDVESAVTEGAINLFAIAGCGSTRALYQLSATVDDAFLAKEHSVTIKFYNKALSDSNRAGFMIYMDGENEEGTATALKALYRYDLNGDVFDLTKRTSCMDGNYLGDLAVNPSLMNWYNQQRLLVSMSQNEDQTFAGIEFKGKASIASIQLTDDKDDFAFIPGDAKAIGVVDTGLATKLAASNFEFEPANGASYANGAITVFDDTTEITVTPTFSADKEYHEITIGDKEGKDSLTFTIEDGTTLTVREAVAAAFVDGEAYEDFDLALAAAAEKSGAMLKLGQDVAKALEIGCIEMTLDLAGKTISGAGVEGHGTIFVSSGALTITNSVPTAGGVVATNEDGVAVNNEFSSSATVAIYGGKFDGFVQNYSEEETPTYEGISVFGGRFSQKPEGATKPDGYEWAQDEDDYWYLKELPKTFAVTWDDSKANATAVAKVDEEQIDNGAEVETGKEVAFTVTPEEGYEYATEPEGGWTLETDGTITKTFTVAKEALEVTIPTATIKTFTVTYIVDGKEDSTEEVNWGKNPANVPTPDAKTGYTGKWDKDPTTAVIKADETFTYTYTAETYTITYTTGNGAVVTNGVTEYTIESDTFNLPVAADIDMSNVEGVTFAGWTNATSEAVVTKVDQGTTGDLEFFAKWEAVAPAEKDPTEDDPTQIPDDETAATRYGDKVPTTLANVSAKSIATWAQKNGKLEKGDDIIENAFLLNCENDQDVVDALEAAFKIPSITVAADGTVTVEEPEGDFNGEIEQWGKVELDQKEWVKDQEGAKFFMLKLVPTNLN